MAPVKPSGIEHHDSNPKTKPGATGFVQEYNQDPGPRQDLNPDAVTENSVLPSKLLPATPRPGTVKRVSKRGK